jgi:hypothetical protein
MINDTGIRTQVAANYVSKPTAGDMLRALRPLLASGGLTRR